MITIVDYKMGNLMSIQNMLKKLGYEAQITSDPEKIRDASKLILPGVGSFGAAMAAITELGITDALNQFVLVDKKPILGICLGMQLMCSYSEEGNIGGLNWIDASVKRFPKVVNEGKLKVPHIGWNKVVGSSEFLKDDTENKFYFVHSYFVELNLKEEQLMESTYGISFCSAFQKDNILGVQFHPEKSHKFGMHLLKTFAS